MKYIQNFQSLKKTLTIIKLYELTYFVLLYTFLLYSFYIYSVSVKQRLFFIHCILTGDCPKNFEHAIITSQNCVLRNFILFILGLIV